RDYETEKRDIEKASAIIEKVTGERPYGFYSMWAPSLNTRTILKDLDFTYDSNEYNDDLPYYRTVVGGQILVVPYSLDTNDFKFIVSDPFGAPSAFLEYLNRSVDVLLEEGERGEPKMLSIGLHLRIIGRPARLWAIQQLMDYLKT